MDDGSPDRKVSEGTILAAGPEDNSSAILSKSMTLSAHHKNLYEAKLKSPGGDLMTA